MTFDKLRDEENLSNRLNLQDEEEILRSYLALNDITGSGGNLKEFNLIRIGVGRE